MSMGNITPPPPPAPALSPTSPNTLTALVQNIAFDIAGLALIGAGIYEAVTGHGTAVASLLALGGTYLGVKVGTAA